MEAGKYYVDWCKIATHDLTHVQLRFVGDFFILFLVDDVHSIDGEKEVLLKKSSASTSPVSRSRLDSQQRGRRATAWAEVS